MNTHKLVATIAAAGALTLGTTGAVVAASAAGGSGSAAATLTAATNPSGSSGSDPSPATHAPACGPKQANRLYLLEQRQVSVHDRITALQAARTKASGHPKLLARITTRIGVLQQRETNIAARLQKLETRCPGLTPVAPTTPGTGSTSVSSDVTGSTTTTVGSGVAPIV